MGIADYRKLMIEEGLNEAYRCVHCGFCLPTCPTYRVTFNEADSPRGRIYLVKELLTGKIKPTDSLLEHLDRCVICRRCETACPSGVQYSKIIEAAYAYLGDKLTNYGYSSFVRTGLKLLENPTIIRLALSLSQSIPGIPNHMRGFARSRDRESLDVVLGRVFEPPRDKPVRARALLFTTNSCVAWQSHTHLVHATIRVLTWNGIEVIVPREFRCCGAPYMHMGRFDKAIELARHNINVVNSYVGKYGGVDYVVIPDSGGCQAQWLEYDRLLRSDSGLRGRVVNPLQLLDAIGVVGDLGPVKMRISVQHSCHMMNVAKAHEAIMRVLGKIPGLEIKGLSTADICCGAGMMYPDRHPDLADGIMRMKIDDVNRVKLDALIIESVTCKAHWANYVHKYNLGIRLMYPTELMDLSYRSGNNPGYENIINRSREI
ncbi:(Fe-S)-binding protein [Vulcanisaeta thermophila]|uniref:(Fe-S)-binding protein n=1 Tax=Vulcanisaeta thermophila TaxID=867917 RepID=UPI000852AF08|nr:(Fe-S)-binding protein [Vulcanisaeta thermophila]